MLDLLKNKEFFILDTETTGLSPKNGDKLVEIAIYKINITDDDKDYIIKDRFITLLNPEIPIPYYVSKIHGIFDLHVRNSPKFYEISDDLLNFIGTGILVIQNAKFDIAFLNRELELCRKDELFNPVIDTIKMSHKVFKGETRHNLDIICHRLNISTNVSRHRAEGDVILTTQAFFKMRQRILYTGF
ncbi:MULTISPECIES: 3'-5' exonuclease [Oceanotoga]|jgi:DNA polymerase III epsilon subunit|uniref:DNA polymerase-3 subunit epsilon n=1 Tax=Oceanotoga teriensis TaxID=515440 RepID=A0AA45HHQ4_9BACT|nr:MULTISPECIES: 3'-5' exonuclease [Oceanotoga]MDN5343158.1 polymerase subunit epsilon [Oceanotoga sp.]MDO7977760.1 3'-5' exonuclease [Oceanotoga teriensis]PWJ87125.1 DNA polymerase-3 subunit epsilon [Oceanotoga teriensis]